MPRPQPGESQDKFVARCIPIMKAEGKFTDPKQIAAICFSLYRNKDKKKKIAEAATNHITSLLTEARKVTSLPHYTKILRKIVKDDDVRALEIKSKTLNAYNRGTPDLYITSALMKILTEKEIIAVLLHEYGHYKHKHSDKSVGMFFSSNILLAVTAGVILKMSANPALIVLAIVLKKTIVAKINRTMEYTADNFAVEYGYGEHLASSFRKVEAWIVKNICKTTDRDKCDIVKKRIYIMSTHPPLEKRARVILNKMDVKGIIADPKEFSKVVKSGKDVGKKIADDIMSTANVQ